MNPKKMLSIRLDEEFIDILDELKAHDDETYVNVIRRVLLIATQPDMFQHFKTISHFVRIKYAGLLADCSPGVRQASMSKYIDYLTIKEVQKRLPQQDVDKLVAAFNRR